MNIKSTITTEPNIIQGGKPTQDLLITLFIIFSIECLPDTIGKTAHLVIYKAKAIPNSEKEFEHMRRMLENPVDSHVTRL